jgi:predicted metal-dependent hydrolase
MALARKDLTEAAHRHAAAMGVRVRRISIRDQNSRWGSCSSQGALSFSWRLIMAPSFVLDYVAVHEVAHLVHMNHGPKFWRLVLSHCSQAKPARDWLKRHGGELHRYQV